MENPHWLAERTKHWGISDDEYHSGGPGAWMDVAYLITATRPSAEIETFVRPITLPDVWRANQARGWRHPDNEDYTKEVVFQRSTRVVDDSYDPDHPYERFRPITIVTKDGELDMATYFEKIRAHEIAPLFED